MLVQSAVARLRTPLLKMMVVILAVAVVVPAAAVATPLDNLDLTLILESQGSGGPLLLVAGQLPEGTQLPAEIVLPVPEDSTIQWAGEIVGTTIEEDIPVEASIELRDGVSVVVFTLEQSRVGQVEVTFPGSVSPVEGDVLSGGFAVSAADDIEAVRLAIAVPPSAQAAELLENTLTAQGPQGFTYYYEEIGPVSAGDPLAYSMHYRQAAISPASGAGQPASGEFPPLLILLIGVAIAGGALVVFATQSRARAARAEDAGLEGAEAVAIARDDDFDDDVAVDDPVEASVPQEAGPEPAPDPEPTPAVPPSSGWLTPQRILITLAVILLGVVLAVILGSQQGQVGVTDMSDGWVSQRISTASADSTSEFHIHILCDCPPEVEAAKIFDALRQVPGVAYAALDTSTLHLQVQYDPAAVDEGTIAALLSRAGYLP